MVENNELGAISCQNNSFIPQNYISRSKSLSSISALTKIINKANFILNSWFEIKKVVFLAPSGAQEMQMFVSSSVCLMKSVLELTIFIFLYQASLRTVSGQSQVRLRSVPGQSQVSPRSVSGQLQSVSGQLQSVLG